MTPKEKKDMHRLKDFLSKHPAGCLLSDDQLLALVRETNELAAIPSFVDEYWQKRKAQPPKNRARLKHLPKQKKLTAEEWEELKELLNEVWPKGS